MREGVTLVPLNGHRTHESGRADPAEPVFVLCAGRSGSTLLRFVLDAHPELACPPETRLPALCAHLLTVWSQLAGIPTGTPPTEIPKHVLRGVRETVGSMVAPYLADRGKRRYCDKSLGSAEHAAALAEIFPTARFLCLYRHPMDLIASGLEATPWGLTGFGFDRYAATSPGNGVLALARYWADHAAAIRTFEQSHPDRCTRIRYEDLVTDPQGTADGIFDALGVSRVRDVEAACFSSDRERQGPGDYKIWHTNSISAGSVGRGWSIPSNLITPDVTARVNGLADDLGYRRLDAAWGTAPVAPDMRVSTEGQTLLPGGTSADSGAKFPAAYHWIAERLQSGLFRLDEQFAERWQSQCSEAFILTASLPTPSTGTDSHVRWLVNLATRTVTAQSGNHSPGAGGATWELSGSTVAWERIFTGNLNLGLALRNRTMRYCHSGKDGAPAQAARIGMLAELLAITTWPASGNRPARPEARERTAETSPFGIRAQTG
jgi:Sulfotransferase family